jgi:hypothetical protein
MKLTKETAKCENCEAVCQIIESISVIFGSPLWYLNCGTCGCFWTSEDKIHWQCLQYVKSELVVNDG